jgi:hypothetical protein
MSTLWSIPLPLGIEKKQLYRKTQPFRKPCNPKWGLAGRCETWLGPLNVSCWPSVTSPLMVDISDMWGELCILRCCETIRQYLKLLKQSFELKDLTKQSRKPNQVGMQNIQYMHKEQSTSTAYKNNQGWYLQQAKGDCPDRVHSDQIVLGTVREEAGPHERWQKMLKGELENKHRDLVRNWHSDSSTYSFSG